MHENVFITLQEYKCELMRTHWLQGSETHLKLAHTPRGIHWLLQLKVLKAGEVWLQAWLDQGAPAEQVSLLWGAPVLVGFHQWVAINLSRSPLTADQSHLKGSIACISPSVSPKIGSHRYELGAQPGPTLWRLGYWETLIGHPGAKGRTGSI